MNPRDAEFKALANSFYDSMNIPRAKPKLVHINLVGERAKWFGLASTILSSYQVGKLNPTKLIQTAVSIMQLQRTR